MAKQIGADTFKHLIDDLRSTHGDNLASVVLYGSSAVGDAVRASDYNLLIALNRITPEDLRLSQAPVREWQRLGNPLPVYFTLNELSDAADVFPIEFRQMERARKVLYGRDPFELVEMSNANLRHQTEYELRSKLLQLRRLYIPASASAARLTALMNDSMASFAALFRAVLLLKNVEPPIAKRETVRATVRLLNLDDEPFERIFDLREASSVAPLTDVEANDLFAAYMEQIDRVIDAVDKIDHTG